MKTLRSHRIGIFAVLLTLFTAAPCARGTPGDLDPLDLDLWGQVQASAVQPDGKTIIVGNFPVVHETSRRFIARLNADGTLDLGFDPNPDNTVNCVAVQADGKVVIGGNFTTLQPNGAGPVTVRNHIARLNPDGALDTGFDPNADNGVYGVAIQADGKVVLGGQFTTLQPNGAGAPATRNHIARVNADGTLDTGFDPNPNSIAVFSVAVQPDGKVLLGGWFTTLQPNGAVVPTTRWNIARVNGDGSLDTGFDPKANSLVWSVAVQPDGKVLLGGQFTALQPNGAPSFTTRNSIARVNGDGTLDTGFDPNANDRVYSVAIQADGKMLLGGNFTTLQPNGAGAASARNRIARVNADGTLDTSFDPNANSGIYGVAIQADGRVLIGGSFTTLQPNGAGTATTRKYFARLVNDPATQALSAPDATQVLWTRGGAGPELSRATFELSTDGGTNWNPLGNGTRIGATADWQLTGLALAGSGQVRARGATVGGYCNGSSGLIEQTTVFSFPAPSANANLDNLVLSTGTLTPAFDAGTTSYAASVPFGNSSLTVTPTAAHPAATITVNGNPVASGSPSGSIALSVGANVITTLVTAQNGVTTKTYTVTVTRAALAPGEPDPLNLNIVGGYVSATAVQPDGRIIIAGSFSSVLGVTRNNIARIYADGTLDLSFDPNADNLIDCVAVQPDGRIVIGGFFQALQPNGAPSPTTCRAIARLEADGALDTTFTPGATNRVLSVVVQPDGKILVAGVFLSIQGTGDAIPTLRQRIARLNADGTLDTVFDPKANGSVTTVALEPGGKILLGGNFTSLQPNGALVATARQYVARVNADGSLDAAFDPKADASVQTLALQADGKILIGGNFSTLQPNGDPAPTTRQHIARVDATGVLDTTFDPMTDNTVYSMAVQTDGKILLGGAFTSLQPNGALAATPRNYVARVNADGTLDAGFDPSANNVVHSVAVTADGKVLLGGEFTTLQPNGSGPLITRNLFALLANDAATQILTATSVSRVEWLRGGASPEVQDVTFELSTDGGAVYALLGFGARIAGGWELTGLSLPATGHLRARALTASGYRNATGGLVETLTNYISAAALAFDGVDDAIEIAAHDDFNPAGGAFTVEGWVKPTSGMPTWARLWGTAANTGDLIVKTNTLERFSFYPLINGSFVPVVAPTNWVSGTWYHLAGVVDGHTARLFVNGVQVAAVDYTGTWTPDPGVRYIGRSISPHAFQGTVDEVRFWSYARNAEQISQARGGELTGSEPSLVAYYKFNQGVAGGDNPSITSVVDSAGAGAHPGTLNGFALTAGNFTSNFVHPGAVESGTLAPTPQFADVNVTGNAVSIWDGDTTPSLIDHTDFGLTTADVTRTFTIENTGNQPLTVSGIALSGPNAGDFTIGSFTPGTLIGAGGSSSFTVTAGATSTSSRYATIIISSGPDADEASYEFAIRSVPSIVVTTTGNAIVATDTLSAGTPWTIAPAGAGNISIAASGRILTVDGVVLEDSTGPIALAGKNSITVNAGAGHDVITVGAFADALPSLTINGGTGNDTVNLNGDITFTTGASLDVDLQNDHFTPGTDNVSVGANANLSTSGTGAITVMVSRNVAMAPGSSLMTANGVLTVYANQQTAATAGSFVGININGGLLQATGTGAVMVKGRGGNAAAGSQIGVRVQGGGDVIGGSGALIVEGSGGASTGPNNYGVQVTGTGTTIGSTASHVQVRGIEGTGASGLSIVATASGAITANAAGAIITLIGNTMHIDATAAVNALAGIVTIVPLTGGVGVNLGAATNLIGGPLSLNDAELDRITAATLNIGIGSTGDIIQSAAISRPFATNLNFNNAANIAINAGTLNSNGGNITFNPGGLAHTVTPTAGGVDVNTGGGTVYFGAGDVLSIPINGPVADYSYRQLNVAGAVDLTGASLGLSGAYVPLPNQTFVILNNDDSDAVTSTFTGLAQGATILFNGVPLAISYVGGTGNDVTLTAANNVPSFIIGSNKTHPAGTLTTQTFTGWATAISDGDSQAVQTLTFTATEVGSSGIFTTPPAIGSTGTLTYRPNGNEGTATFSVRLADSGGAISAPQSFTITVQPDTTAPTVTITAPGAGARVPESVPTGLINVTGTAADNKRVSKVEVNLNNGGFVDAVTTVAANGLTASYTAAVSPVAGTNTLVVRSIDDANNVSALVTRAFTYVVMRPFAPTIVPAAGGTVTLSPALVSGKAQIGTTYTFKAAAKAGYFWDYWNGSGVTGAPVTNAQLTVVMTEAIAAGPDAITANFLPTPFSAGSYTGLATPAIGTVPSQNNLGRISGTLTTTGRLTGSVNFAGTLASFLAIFEPHTGDAAGTNSTNLSWNLHLDLTGGTDKITGTISKLSGGSVTDVCNVNADRATFSTLNPVPSQFVNGTGNGIYTVAFPAKTQAAPMDISTYPQGDGYGTVTMTPSGSVYLAGTLADGTAVTANAPLSKYHQWPLAVIIKSSATVAGMTLGGMVQFDTAPTDSDLTASDLQWFRPAFASAPSYVAGWPGGIAVDAVGARYDSTIPVQTTLDLGTPDPDNGELMFTDGNLTSVILIGNFKIEGNTVTKIPTSDASFTVTVNPGNGMFSGTFTPNWASPAAAKPVYRGVMLQKGGSKGGYGFFISNAVGDPTPQSGSATLGRQGPLQVDFDTQGNNQPVYAYLAKYGITITNETSPNSLRSLDDQIIYGGGVVQSTTPHIYLGTVGPPAGSTCSFRMNFAAPLNRVEVDNCGVLVPSINASWTMTAYNAGGQQVAQVLFTSPPATFAPSTFVLQPGAGQTISSILVVNNSSFSAAFATGNWDTFLLYPSFAPTP